MTSDFSPPPSPETTISTQVRYAMTAAALAGFAQVDRLALQLCSEPLPLLHRTPPCEECPSRSGARKISAGPIPIS